MGEKEADYKSEGLLYETRPMKSSMGHDQSSGGVDRRSVAAAIHQTGPGQAPSWTSNGRRGTLCIGTKYPQVPKSRGRKHCRMFWTLRSRFHAHAALLGHTLRVRASVSAWPCRKTWAQGTPCRMTGEAFQMSGDAKLGGGGDAVMLLVVDVVAVG